MFADGNRKGYVVVAIDYTHQWVLKLVTEVKVELVIWEGMTVDEGQGARRWLRQIGSLTSKSKTNWFCNG